MLIHAGRVIGLCQQGQIFVCEAVLALQQIVDVVFHVIHVAVVIVDIGTNEQELSKVPFRRRVFAVPQSVDGVVQLVVAVAVGEENGFVHLDCPEVFSQLLGNVEFGLEFLHFFLPKPNVIIGILIVAVEEMI